MAPPFKHPPEVIPCLKALIVEAIHLGKPVNQAAAYYGVTWRAWLRWRREDPAFAKAVNEASEYRAVMFPPSDCGGRPPKRTPEEIAELKAMIPPMIADMRLPVSKALRELGITHYEWRDWRRDDPGFQREVNDAKKHFAETEADRLRDLHEEIGDAKACAVASKNLMWYIEKLDPEGYGPKINPREGNSADLVGILQSAVNRLIDHVAVQGQVAPATPLPVIDLQPQPVKQERTDDPR